MILTDMIMMLRIHAKKQNVEWHTTQYSMVGQ